MRIYECSVRVAVSFVELSILELRRQSFDTARAPAETQTNRSRARAVQRYTLIHIHTASPRSQALSLLGLTSFECANFTATLAVCHKLLMTNCGMAKVLPPRRVSCSKKHEEEAREHEQ